MLNPTTKRLMATLSLGILMLCAWLSSAMAQPTPGNRIAVGKLGANFADISDTQPGAPNNSSFDRLVVDRFTPQGIAAFEINVIAQDKGARSIRFELEAGSNTFPKGTNLRIRRGGEIADLSNAGGHADTLDADSPHRGYLVRLILPDGDMTNGALQGPFSAKLIGRDAEDSSIFDAVLLTVTSLGDPDFNVTLTPNGANNLHAGEFVTYAHQLTKKGVGQCGTYRPSVEIPPADAAAGWSAEIYPDATGSGKLTPGMVALRSGQAMATPLNGNAVQGLIVRMQAPVNAANDKINAAV